MCNTQSQEGQERKGNPKFKGRLVKSKEELDESERDPGRGVSDQLGESGLCEENPKSETLGAI